MAMDRASAKTVLVIDDDDDVCNLARAHLERAGYLVETLGSVEAGLNRLRNGDPLPHLILLDGILPGMDGADFLREIADDESLPVLPVVLMSDMIDLSRTKIPARVMIAGRLDKPFTSEVLLRTVGDAFAQTPKA